jgi:hypothetical protein
VFIGTVLLAATLATDAPTIHALKWAVKQWERALHHKIEMPAIYHGDAVKDCQDSEDLACCTRIGKRIIVVEEMNKKDLRSVMLHEMGHMLGLDDIEGDVVMEPEHQHCAQKLTPLDIFYARLANNWFE